MESMLELEFQRRMDAWDRLQKSPNWPNILPEEIRSLDLYAGQAGVYRDAERTRSIMDAGITVSILNTSGNYSDEISDDRLIYSYPQTLRKGQDIPEIQSLKNAMLLQIPIFVISETAGGRRNVRLGWIEGCEDAASCCLVKLDTAPDSTVQPELELEENFSPTIKRNLKVAEIQKLERDPRFKFNALTLYKCTCAVTDITVERMLDAAHVVPVAENGSDHPKNSLLLNAAVHRTFDSHYWAIEPESLKIAVRKIGPTLESMKFKRTSISHLDQKPHPEALEIRWRSFRKACNEKFEFCS